MCQSSCKTSADFEMMYPDEDSWYDELQLIAAAHDVSVADRDAWIEGFGNHETPAQSFYGEYPEYLKAPKTAATKDLSDRTVKSPCKECPWKRSSAAGWLGASTAGEFIALSESGQHLPCHLHVNYEQSDEDWRDEADRAPQCAGHAIYLANRCKLPKDSAQLVLPADREQIFTWPHEFVAHHKRVDPETLKGVMVLDLINL